MRLLPGLLFTGLLTFSLSSIASAQTPSLIPEDPLSIHEDCNFVTGEVHADCIPAYIAYVIRQIFVMSGTIFLFVIIYGGYEYALGDMVGGEQKAVARIRYGIVGMVCCGLSFFLVDFVVSALAGI